MAYRIESDLAGTFASAFALGLKAVRATLSAAGLTAPRTYTLPDASGTLALLEASQEYTGLPAFAAGLSVTGGSTPGDGRISVQGTSSHKWFLLTFGASHADPTALAFYNGTLFTTPVLLNPSTLRMVSGFQLVWGSNGTSVELGATDVGLRRSASGALAVTNGGSGDGSITAANLVARVAVPGVDGKTVANTLLYTVPTGRRFVPVRFVVRPTASVGISAGPQMGFGTAPGTSNIVTSQNMANLKTTNDDYVWPVVGASVVVAAGVGVYANLGAAATGTSQTLAVEVWGVLI